MTEATGGALLDVFRVLDLAGVLGNAVLAGVMARAARLDPVGFAVLAIISGLGGGMIRDTLLQQGPPVALLDPAYVLTALAGAALAFLVEVEGRRPWEWVYPWIDAVALGCWAATGALKTLDSGLGWLPALMLGTVTATGGGFLRDVILRQVPTVLGQSPLYATCALVASAAMAVMHRAGASTWGMLVATAAGASLCLVARRRSWMLPVDASWGTLRREGESRLRALERLRRRQRGEE